ncbi:hypothetical protein MRB53_037177 [Persea americana]|nr:hypothetical protein MRB53_037177 [Persea americana]
MNAIDGTEHYERAADAVANILVFINAHLAFHYENRVAVIASHCQRIAWLYPTPPSQHDDEASTETASTASANKYRPFRLIEDEVFANLRRLINSTSEEDLAATQTTALAGALSEALAYISKQITSLTPTAHGLDALAATSLGAEADAPASALNSRVLIISTSGDLAGQYIPIMNVIFAAQHLRIPIDILKLAGDTVLLQQASYTTAGIFLSPSAPATTKGGGAVRSNPQGLLQYLFQAFLPDAAARKHLVPSTAVNVDFRAACFCHRKVVDIGYVCSICLSIFCEATLLVDGVCLTCGTPLNMGALGDASREPRKKKKRKKADGSATAVPNGA